MPQPIEGIKSRLQVQYHAVGAKAATAATATTTGAATSVATAHAAPLYTGPRSCVAHVLATQGVAGLYRGLLPVMFCRMSNYAYFGAYEMWKGVYARFMQPPTVAAALAPGARAAPVPASKPTKAAAVFSGGMAGICYWFSCYVSGTTKQINECQPAAAPVAASCP